MSTVKELADAEAARAEADDAPATTGDDAPATPGEATPPELAPEGPPFDPKKLEAELRRHAREMENVLGEGWADMKACDECGGAGFVPSDYEPLPPVVADPFAVACPDCNGYGLRSTPSLREGNQTIPCDACGGAGWRDRRQVEAMQAVAAYQAPVYPPPPPAQPVWNPTSQQWETANGAPAYPPPPAAPAAPPAA